MPLFLVGSPREQFPSSPSAGGHPRDRRPARFLPTPPVSRRTLLWWIVLRRTVGWPALRGSLLRRPLPGGMESRIPRSAARVLGERAESQLAALSSALLQPRIPSTEAGGQPEPGWFRRSRSLQTRSRRQRRDLHRRRTPRRLPFRVHTERDSLGTRPDRRQPGRFGHSSPGNWRRRWKRRQTRGTPLNTGTTAREFEFETERSRHGAGAALAHLAQPHFPPEFERPLTGL